MGHGDADRVRRGLDGNVHVRGPARRVPQLVADAVRDPVGPAAAVPVPLGPQTERVVRAVRHGILDVERCRAVVGSGRVVRLAARDRLECDDRRGAGIVRAEVDLDVDQLVVRRRKDGRCQARADDRRGRVDDVGDAVGAVGNARGVGDHDRDRVLAQSEGIGERHACPQEHLVRLAVVLEPLVGERASVRIARARGIEEDLGLSLPGALLHLVLACSRWGHARQQIGREREADRSVVGTDLDDRRDRHDRPVAVGDDVARVL